MRYKIIIIMAALLALADQRAMAQRTFKIDNEQDFALFLQRVNEKYYQKVDTIKLSRDLTLTTNSVIGSEVSSPFTGVFDGQGNTITIQFDKAIALFGNIQDATIKHLKVTGEIKNGPIHASGLVGQTVSGTNLITDCRVSTVVHCGYTDKDGAHGGGIIGHGGEAENTVRGCVFDGEMIAEIKGCRFPENSFCGAIIGWCQNAGTMTIEHCVEMGKYKDFSRYELIYSYHEGYATLKNNYRSHTPVNNSDINWKQGLWMHKVEPNTLDYVGLTFGNIKEIFLTSGIQVSSDTDGLIIDGVLHAAEGQTVCFDIAPTLKKATYERPNIFGGIITKGERFYRLPMANSDWSIGAMVTHKDSVMKGTGTEADPYIIASNLHWNQLCHNVDQGESYSGKYFKLDCDLHTRYMVGSEGKFFSGTFDGNGSERRIRLNTVNTERISGLFRFIKNADIRKVNIEGELVVSNQHAGGLVGCSSGNSRISNCLVHTNIKSTYKGDAGHGGIVATTWPDDARLTITACKYAGKFDDVRNATSGWGGFVGYRNGTVEVHYSLFSPEFNSSYTASNFEGSANFVRNSNNNQVNESNNYYTYALHGNTQGKDASQLNKAYLTSLLGVYNWEQDFNHGGNAIPLMTNRTIKDVYSSEDLKDCLNKTGSYCMHFGVALHNDGMLNTICLPFDMHINHSMFAQGGELYKFYEVVTEGNTTNLVFLRTYQIVAGVPYLIRWTDPHTYFDRDAVWYTGATITTLTPQKVTNSGYSFCGNFDPIYQSQAADQGIYVMGDNNTWHPVKTTTSEKMLLGGFHAYLQMPSSHNAVSFKFVDESDQTTAIIPIKMDESVSNHGNGQTSPARWYTLDGRQLQYAPTEKGIYIYNGKKVIK